MDLSDVHFTAKDVKDFFDELDIDAIIKNISMMPSDDETESSFSHSLDINLYPQLDNLGKRNKNLRS